MDSRRAGRIRACRPHPDPQAALFAPDQVRAIHQPQAAVREGKKRFLFEMATGTGKTLSAAAVVKLFLCSVSARRVLFLVGRLELQDQAAKAVEEYLKNDSTGVIYKEYCEDWHGAELVTTTAQSVLFHNKYRRLSSPTDFDLEISDERHRSSGGNPGTVFDYSIGCKLGLAAAPKKYPGGFDAIKGAHSRPARNRAPPASLHLPYLWLGEWPADLRLFPTGLGGVRDDYPLSPTIVKADTGVTTQLLCEEGVIVSFTSEDQQDTFEQREFGRRFFSHAANAVFCKCETSFENSLRDPVSAKIG